MKKRVWSIFLTLVLTFCMMSMTALAATPTEIKIQADKTEVHPGDTITYTITFGAVQNLQGAEFKLSIPEGLTYIDNSGKTAEGLVTLLDAEKAEFTEDSKKFVAGGGGAYTSEGITTIMTFQCTVDEDATGDYAITLINPDISDNQWEGIPFTVNSDASKVTVTPRPVAVTGVTLDKTTLALNIGDTETLTATVVPGEATNKKVTFSSDNIAVATVDASAGVVTAVEEGKTVIIVTTEDGSKTATCEVTVSCGHANKTQTDAKDSTCVDKGWDAYYTCDHCGQMFKADGSTRIDAIPYRDLAAHKGGIATCVNKAVCTVCNQAYGDLASHSYTEQDVSAEHLKTTGTCKVEAVYYMSCVVCGSNGTDTFNGAKDSDNHVNTTMINQKEASCEEDGYSGDVQCQDCDTIIANGSTVKATGHTEASGWTQDETDHWKKCSVCGEICSSKTAHSYDTTTWKTDATGHWHACICGAKSDFTEHTPDRAEATETDAVKCTDCGYIIIPELGHNHKFDKKVVDEKYLKAAADCENAAAYYMSCTCGQASDILTFVSGDAKGHTVDGNAWKSDADNHWNECACGEKLNSAAHKDANNDNKCDVCAYQLPVATVKPNTNSDNTSVNAGTAATQPEVVLSPKTGENSFALWCACVAFALGVGIVGVTWYKKQAHS